jgi:hypothetical protein
MVAYPFPSATTEALVECSTERVRRLYPISTPKDDTSVLQTDVQPGTVILMKGNEAFLGDHILDYVDQGADSSREYGTFGGLAKDDVDAVLRKFSENTALSGKTAMSFLTSVFRLRPSFDLGNL